MSKADGSASRFWDTALAFAGIAVATIFYVGYSHLQGSLSSTFGFTGPILSLYSYDELLLRGLTVVFHDLAPVLVASTFCGLLLYLLVRHRAWSLWLGRLVAGAFVLFALAIPWAGGLSWRLTSRSPGTVLFLVLLSMTLSTALLLQDRAFLPPSALPWLRHAVIASGWVFTVWLVPYALLFARPPTFSSALVFYAANDDRYPNCLSYVTRTDGAFILGDKDNKRLLVLPGDAVKEVWINSCTDLSSSQ
jgi:hypothetical protein